MLLWPLHKIARVPYASGGAFLYVGSVWLKDWIPHAVLGGIAILSILIGASLSRLPRSRETRFGQRRRLEIAICMLLVMHLARHAVRTDIAVHALFFVVFLLFVYQNYPLGALVGLLLLHTGLSLGFATNVGNTMALEWPSLVLLWAWTMSALFFRFQEQKRRMHVADRLALYERDANSFSIRSQEVEASLRLDEKTNRHLAHMLAQQEASSKAFLLLIRQVFRPHTCALYFYDPYKEVFVLRDHWSESKELCVKKEQSLQGVFRILHRQQSPVVLCGSHALRGLVYDRKNERVRAFLGLSLRSGQLLKGAVFLDRLDETAFSPEQIELFSQLAGQFLRTMEYAESLHAHFHLKEELSSFYAASTSLNRSLKMEEVISTLLQSTRGITQYDLGLVVLFDANTQTLRIAAEVGIDSQGLAGSECLCVMEESLVSWVVQHRTPLAYNGFCSRASRSPLFDFAIKPPNVFESVLLVPMHVQNESIGAVVFLSKKDHFFSKSVRKMLEVIVVQASVSIKNARMVRQLEKLATTDGLTGLFNHRTFQELLALELERSQRHEASTSLLLMDIDFFKKFNDEYGHPTGDYVLKELGSVLGQAVRKVDVAGRYGGEEFAVILSHTPVLGAIKMAERIRHTVAAHRFHYQGLALRVSVSVGAATFPTHARQREALIECADRALYEAKRLGRNRVVSYDLSIRDKSPYPQAQDPMLSIQNETRRAIDHRRVTV